jgi:hypothetical protein
MVKQPPFGRAKKTGGGVWGRQEAAMTNPTINGAAAGAEEVRHAALLAAALHAICLANQSWLNAHRLIVSRPPSFYADLDFEGQVPVGFAFSDGHEAIFHVPTGHRFVIEHVYVSPDSSEAEIEVQMITRSKQMFRQMTIGSTNSRTEVSTPFVVPGSSANTLLFRNGGQQSSFLVPVGGYVQIWGYLEPTKQDMTP